MNLKKVLSEDVISMDLKGDSKAEIIESLLNILMSTGKVADKDEARQAIMDREEKMSTGIQHGVAIPHGKTRAVDELVACIGLKKDGVDFEALDGKESNIFIMTLSPVDRTGPHVQFLGEVSQVLKREDERQALLNAQTPAEVLEIFTGS